MKSKLRIGFDVSPLYSGHKVRGVGFYTERLLGEIKKFRNLEIIELKSERDIGNKDFDVLHIPYFHPFFFTVPFKKRKPIIITIHDLIPIKYPKHYPPGIKGRIRWEIQKILLRKNVGFIITDSFASKYDINDLTGYPQDRIYPVYLAADRIFKRLEVGSWKLEVKQKYQLPDIFALYVGDINWNKNLPSLVVACEKIGVPLVIVGKQATQTDFDRLHIENKDLCWLQEKARVAKFLNLYNSKSLVFVGFVPTIDLVAIYNLATCYCQPSFDEGFGLPILEAFACGCPVVSSDAGSLPEIAKDAALVVKPKVKELTKAIKEIIDNSALGDKLKLRGYERVRDFSWKKTAKKTVFIYKLSQEKNL